MTQLARTTARSAGTFGRPGGQAGVPKVDKLLLSPDSQGERCRPGPAGELLSARVVPKPLPHCTRCTRCSAVQAMQSKAAGPGWLQSGNEAKARGCRTAIVVRPCSTARVGSKSARQRCCRGLAAASGRKVRTRQALPLLLAGPASPCPSQTPRRSLTAEAKNEMNLGQSVAAGP
jgi:hypothetical protein